MYFTRKEFILSDDYIVVVTPYSLKGGSLREFVRELNIIDYKGYIGFIVHFCLDKVKVDKIFIDDIFFDGHGCVVIDRRSNVEGKVELLILAGCDDLIVHWNDFITLIMNVIDTSVDCILSEMVD